jgi:polysaccharide export outer membrane protein
MMSRWFKTKELRLNVLKTPAEFPGGDESCPGNLYRLFGAALVLLIALLVTGCQTSAPSAQTNQPPSGGPEVDRLREGDLLKITFPGAPNLDTNVQVRAGGKILLPLIGEMTVTDMTVPLLEKQLKNRYASELVSNQVIVTVDSSSFTVYVTGAVLHQGKISASHPLTALEAVMEAGGPDHLKANLKKVKVTRREGSRYRPYIVNLQRAMEGKEAQPFYLQSGDIVEVPEKFILF